VGDEMQDTFGRPIRLKDRLRRRPRYFSRVGYGAVITQITNPQFRAIPRHLRMHPACPRQFLTVGTDPWKRVEVGTTKNDFCGSRTVSRHRYDFVRRFFAFLMTFTNANDGLPIRRHAEVRISRAGSYRGIGSNGTWRARRVLSIQTLIFEVAEEDGI